MLNGQWTRHLSGSIDFSSTVDQMLFLLAIIKHLIICKCTCDCEIANMSTVMFTFMTAA